MTYHCFCCGYRTLPEEPPGTFYICDVCGWEDDELQARDPNQEGGANTMSLRVGRSNFRAFGSRDPAPKSPVRAPRDEEGPPIEVDVLAGRQITQIRVDYAVTLLGESDLLVIGTPFKLTDRGGTHRPVDVEARAADAAPVLGRLHRSVVSGIYSEGILELIFDDQARIVVPASTKFESWTLNREDRSMVVCGPGGKLVLWGPQSA